MNRQRRLLAAWTDRTAITNKYLYVIKPLGPEAWQQDLALLNSKLISRMYVRRTSGATTDDLPQATIADLSSLPLQPIELQRKSELALHARIVALADMLTALTTASASASDTTDADVQRQIAATDAQSDRLVNELHELTREDIAVVEGADA